MTVSTLLIFLCSFLMSFSFQIFICFWLFIFIPKLSSLLFSGGQYERLFWGIFELIKVLFFRSTLFLFCIKFLCCWARFIILFGIKQSILVIWLILDNKVRDFYVLVFCMFWSLTPSKFLTIFLAHMRQTCPKYHESKRLLSDICVLWDA